MGVMVSIVASTIRPDLWGGFASSLMANAVPYEIIFVGRNEQCLPVPPRVRFIKSNTKPAQCYEIGFRAASGTLLHWTADDAEYELHLLDKVWDMYQRVNNRKLLIAIRTVENGRDCTEWHHLIGGRRDTPIMAPFGFMNREFFHELGGYDNRFVCGQSENDVVMRVYEAGGE